MEEADIGQFVATLRLACGEAASGFSVDASLILIQNTLHMHRQLVMATSSKSRGSELSNDMQLAHQFYSKCHSRGILKLTPQVHLSHFHGFSAAGLIPECYLKAGLESGRTWKFPCES